jgi:hypothetical protein
VVILAKIVNRGKASGSILLLVMGMMLLATSLVAAFLKGVMAETVYNTQLKDQIDLKVQAYSYMDLTIGTISKLREEWGGLLFTKDWLRGYTKTAGSNTSGNTGNNSTTKTHGMPDKELKDCFMQTLIKRAGLKNEATREIEAGNNNKIKIITGIKAGDFTIEIAVEDETGKLPLSTEFYQKLKSPKGQHKLHEIYTAAICSNVLKSTDTKIIQNIGQIIDDIFKIQGQPTGGSSGSAGKPVPETQIGSARHFAKLVQLQETGVGFFNGSGEETEVFGRLQKHFTVIPEFSKIAEKFKINLLTACKSLLVKDLKVNNAKGLLYARDLIEGHKSELREIDTSNSGSTGGSGGTPKGTLIQSARKQPKQYTWFKDAISKIENPKTGSSTTPAPGAPASGGAQPAAPFKDFTDFEATCLRIKVRVIGPSSGNNKSNDFTLVAMVTTLGENKESRFGDFSVLSFNEV